MTFSRVVVFGAAVVLAAVVAAAASPSEAVGVVRPPALHVSFRQLSTVPPELLVGKQPPGFFAPGTEPSGVPQIGPSPTPTETMEPSMTPTPSASMTPTASPTATPVPSGGALTPTRVRVSVRRSGGKVLARTRDAECVLTTYKGYRPRVVSSRNVVYTNAAGKQMAVVGLRRRASCVIRGGIPSRGAPTGVVHGGKIYAALGASGEGGWCEAGAALAKDTVTRARWRKRRQDIQMYVYTQGEAQCELVPGSRKPEEDD